MKNTNTNTNTLNSINRSPKKINLSLAAARELYPTKVKDIIETKNIVWEKTENFSDFTTRLDTETSLNRYIWWKLNPLKDTLSYLWIDNINTTPINNTIELGHLAA